MVYAMTRTLPFSPGSSMLERRPKRKVKGKLALEKYRSNIPVASKGRKPSQTFQKKLVVVDYMGPDAPRNFALKEVHVLLRGMLPEIGISANEEEVRGYICDTIKHSEKSLQKFLPCDFEFFEASGKCLCIPAHHATFMWTGRAIKGLAGTGAVYVRLTVEREMDESSSEQSDSSDDLPYVKVPRSEPSDGKQCIPIRISYRGMGN